jgi:hypothetical protein
MREPHKLLELENIMTTETKLDKTTENAETSTTENQAASNKAVFGPLGKYAVIAVIMVSVIVTTAIMLNKELSTVEGNIATIENVVVENISADAGSATTETQNINTTASVNATQVNASVAPSEATPDNISSVATTATTVTTETVAEVATTTETTVANTAPTEKTVSTGIATIQTRQAQLTAENQARIAAFKLEQKQHMSEMFARIKTLEAQQLEQYKSHQDTQVERLREQIAAQQQMIETLISRNKELYDLRAANVQEHQTKREELINRI